MICSRHIGNSLARALLLLIVLGGYLSNATGAGALVSVDLMVGQMRDLAGVTDRYHDWSVAWQKGHCLLAVRVADGNLQPAKQDET